MTDAWDIVLHLDRHVAAVSADYGLWSYVLLFGVVFAETGLVVTTILPSDTVLFAAGAMAAKGMFPLWALYPGFCLAAFAGDAAAYLAGVFLGDRFVSRGKVPFVSPEALAKAHEYYALHGGMTVVAARFVPILRLVVPLVGGVAGMALPRFLAFNALGKAVWAAIYVFGGYFFGRIPWMEKNFAVVILVAMGAPFLAAGLRVSYLFWRQATRRPKG
ncbi:MAG: VTT domain-containing protein [Thermodesulfobacteriota bacterium]